MVRITMIVLCLLLAGAAAGRYKAEVSVRETREEIEAIEKAKVEELSEIQILRAEIAYLESPDRLAKVAAAVTALEPLTAPQLMTADEFLLAFGGAHEAGEAADLPHDDVILRALAMADAPTQE